MGARLSVCVSVFGVMDWQFHVPGSCLVSAHQTRLEEIHRMVAYPPAPTPPPPPPHSLLQTFLLQTDKSLPTHATKVCCTALFFLKHITHTLSRAHTLSNGAQTECVSARCTQRFCGINTAAESHLGAHSPSSLHLLVPVHPHIQGSGLQGREREGITNPLTALGRLSTTPPPILSPSPLSKMCVIQQLYYS